jgi:competence protein ComEA
MHAFRRSLTALLATLAFAAGAGFALPAHASDTGAHGRKHHSYAGKVNVNTASETQLTALPGIGPAKARRIVAARQHKRFARPQDLVRVKGIGPKTVRKLMPYLAVSGPTNFREK